MRVYVGPVHPPSENPGYAHEMTAVFLSMRQRSWCGRVMIVSQAACTSWKRVLSQANGAPSHINVHSRHVYRYVDLFNSLSSTAKQRVLETHFKFMFVRHPFERLVSAHQDKFVDTK